MKRSPMKRYRPAKRSKATKAWEAQWYLCWVCHVEPATATHEIARGPHRAKALDNLAALIRTCDNCHRDKLDAMPVVEQLAIKKTMDPETYDRAGVNRLRSRAPESITEAEVNEAINQLDHARRLVAVEQPATSPPSGCFRDGEGVGLLGRDEK